MANQPETKKEQEKRKVKIPQAKAAGLKSTFLVNGEVVMTTFGNGNEAILEKKIDKKNTVTDIARPANISVKPEPEKKKIRIKSSRVDVDAVADRPADNQGMDLLRAKSELEMKYFGKTFTDNVHIQIIYNIIDIYKILAEYSTNIVYELGNVCRVPDATEQDHVGSFSAGKSFGKWDDDSDPHHHKEFFDAFKKQYGQLAYFGDAFLRKRYKKNTYVVREDEELYNVLALVGMLRQICAHGYMEQKENKDPEVSSTESNETWLFNLDRLDRVNLGFRGLLDEFYKNAVDSVNESFFANADKNVYLLSAMYPEKKIADLVRDYYKFAILKDYKTYGFSIRVLREELLKIDDIDLSYFVSDACKSFRQKINLLLDFSLVSFYRSSDRKAKMVEQLRLAARDEKKKQKIYEEEAKVVWETLAPLVHEKMRPKMTTEAIEKATMNGTLPTSIPGIIQNRADPFSELIFFLTKFLDGKEINILLTTLINKFDNIYSLCEVLQKTKLASYENYFVKEYRMFENSYRIVKTLKEINCFSRMQKALPTAKKTMFREALELFGFTGSDEEFERICDKIFCNETDQYGILKRKEKTVGDTGFRNFVASNVIESSRFQYLIRYCNPKKIRELAGNRTLIDFQLKRLPETQIDRYYKACHGPKETILDKKISYLAGLIHDISFHDFEDIKTMNPADRSITESDRVKNEKMKGIISLYLTILFLLVKNLVNVNSRYVIAFAACSRDSRLILGQSPDDQKAKKEKGELSWLALTRYFCEPDRFTARGMTCPIKERARNYLMKDAGMIDEKDWMLKQFRNKVAHLNVIQSLNEYAGEIKQADSYFGIYHFILQRVLPVSAELERKEENLSPKAQNWSAIVKQTGTYCKDYVKALCTPFGYNLARFKNLSIEALFDKNELKETKEQGEIGETND